MFPGPRRGLLSDDAERRSTPAPNVAATPVISFNVLVMVFALGCRHRARLLQHQAVEAAAAPARRGAQQSELRGRRGAELPARGHRQRPGPGLVNDPAVQGRGAVTGARSDTIMILHVDPKATKAALLSLPRDLWVTIAGTDTQSKINAAIEIGGPQQLIETIQQNFRHPDQPLRRGRLPRVQEAGQGHRRRADLLQHGVPRHPRHTAINDRPTAAAATRSDPDDALAYARTRYAEYQATPGDNNSWVEDGTADLGRISRQQDFMRKALARAVTKGIRNPQRAEPPRQRRSGRGRRRPEPHHRQHPRRRAPSSRTSTPRA